MKLDNDDAKQTCRYWEITARNQMFKMHRKAFTRPGNTTTAFILWYNNKKSFPVRFSNDFCWGEKRCCDNQLSDNQSNHIHQNDR